jgi:hypothetical protein
MRILYIVYSGNHTAIVPWLPNREPAIDLDSPSDASWLIPGTDLEDPAYVGWMLD